MLTNRIKPNFLREKNWQPEQAKIQKEAGLEEKAKS